MSDKCWIWNGHISKNGYGKLGARLAHRISYEVFRGPIPKDKQIDHLCRNRCCVNPWHLEIVTQKENILRGISWSAKNHKKTHCPKGHPYDSSNTYVRKHGWRMCLTCEKNRKATDQYKVAANERMRRNYVSSKELK